MTLLGNKFVKRAHKCSGRMASTPKMTDDSFGRRQTDNRAQQRADYGYDGQRIHALTKPRERRNVCCSQGQIWWDIGGRTGM
jgi:hypothetical protein